MRLLPACVAGAVALGVGLGLVAPFPPAALGAALAAAFAAAVVSFRQGKGPRVLVCTLAGAAFGGWALSVLNDGRARDPPLAAATRLPSPIVLEGVIDADAVPDGESVRLRLAGARAAGLPPGATGDVSLGVAGRRALSAWPAWRAGRTVRLRAAVRPPAVYRDDGVGDDRLALARRGLVLVGSVKSASLVDVLARGSPLDELGASLRRFVREAVGRHVGAIDPLAGRITTAILIGDRTGIDPALTDRLQAAGTYHVIAISGGNIAIFASTLLLVVWLLRVPGPLAAVLAIVTVWLYAGLVGGGASVVRATTMATVYLGLQVRDLRARPVCALAAASSLMLVASPLEAADAGFLLTVGATGAIVVLAGRFMKVAAWPRALRPVAAVVAASVATEVVLLPVSAMLFGRVTAAGPVLNLAAVPAMALVQQSGMAVVALAGWWPSGAALAGRIAAWGTWALVRSADLVDWLPVLAARVPAPAWWAMFAYAAGGAAALGAGALHAVTCRRRRRLRLAGTVVAAVVAAWIVWHPATWRVPWRGDGRLHVTSIDVGQGDSTLVTLPDETTILVDTGGLGADAAFDIGARVVAPAIWARGVGRIDALLLTHGDPDHIGGAAAIIEVFRPGVVWEGIAVAGQAPMEALRTLAKQRAVPWETLTAGADWERAGVRLHVWSPAPPDWARRKVRNDDSVVLELRYGDVSIVLPGDIGREVERLLAAELAPSRLRVLKLAHHGSATSSSAVFLDALRPTLALVSCGRDNRFGHPAADVMARLAERRIPVFRTDADGEVDVVTDGTTVTARSVGQGP